MSQLLHQNADLEKIMYMIKSNKIQLYNLVADYIYLPKMEYTEFVIGHEGNMYGLQWYAMKDTHYCAFYFVENDIPLLVVQYRRTPDDPYIDCIVRSLDVKYLENSDMIIDV